MSTASLGPWRPWMLRALQLASLGSGRTSPNPMVGCVVLDAEGRLVGEGYHSRAGEAHAEVGALRQAGERARGGTAVVTLEPCCHHGRTPPCSEALLAAGIRRVVVAMADPDPQVAGGGLAQLRSAGVEVIEGVAAEEARALNRAFLHRIAHRRPFGILKWAMGVDGRTALPNGASQWISGPEARSWVHGLRGRCDAVIVGGGTVRADDPLLTSRGRRQPEPLRVVLSRSLDLPAEARLWDTATAPTLVAHGYEAPARRRFQLDRRGIERLVLQACEPWALMQELARRGCNLVLWECGAALATAALRQGCVQEVAAVIAPKLMGGTLARTPLGDLGLTGMPQVPAWQTTCPQQLGDDLLWQLHAPELDRRWTSPPLPAQRCPSP
ncbi:bifunctional diaminohydroxyphosphoribosylaminopyrimidine deaminase/5-amino-6-(5-phosphoribosylamino)uracil reductase RibD [Cyanobium sp. NIES-981]|uniref:bifunctional diaminohydroxyphosphoribosylaminopyrimidine deaminase/5-amino-6-(5-phosphoribosylamino)uracil reductase RibD n=1 Tax=Cyanobium sp. NIES-981 TaxID=1851505 RepID=UPI0007DD5543|nr:bifunctional diaminohydroxyphosphoribosylaminopyrimidine deaminase/5-amino-6-(5-phosphoribosylamino)uracil reductase RibD [Cyanobium sp. NIES-981]SBO44424.1 Riboflavin biosynthesis protein RibD [Includes: Diaminohydroxyphosphoribosylaminopyrimidine deaminase; 5-amino-6-(5-phosphoribosylamino)uracil reductase] [Cyanobium sp. NIES-981]